MELLWPLLLATTFQENLLEDITKIRKMLDLQPQDADVIYLVTEQSARAKGEGEKENSHRNRPSSHMADEQSNQIQKVLEAF